MADYDKNKLATIGVKLNELLTEFKKSRQELEQQWLKNYRQMRGVYDPEMLSQIPDGFSKAYPKLTRQKVKQLLARMMEMLFPGNERNWEIVPSPVPNIPEQALQQILQQLQQQAKAAAQQRSEAAKAQGQNIPPLADPLSDDMIEQAIQEWTRNRAERMSEECSDQLQQNKFAQLAKRVIRSGIMYGLGVLRGPMTDTYKRRTWQRDAQGNYAAAVTDQFWPIFEYVRVWDFFADFSLKSFTHSVGFFERNVMSKRAVEALKLRPDFIASQISEFLRANPTGNYKEQNFDQVLRSSQSKNAQPAVTGSALCPYELMRYVGFMGKQDMQEMGVTLKSTSDADNVLMDIWMAGNTVVKANEFYPFESPLDNYHLFILEDEDEASAVGPGLPENMRDSQMAVAAAARMMFDNASVSCGPFFEINQDLLKNPAEKINIRAFGRVHRQGDGVESQWPAVRAYRFDSHIPELMQIYSTFTDQSDSEAMLPRFASGYVDQGSEAFRTTGSASMLFGAANMTVKDTVRGFDSFVESVVGALVKWNENFGSRSDIVGDFNVMPKGATSLVAKELQAVSLDQMTAVMDPEDKIYLRRREVLVRKFRTRDLDPDALLLTEEEAQAELARRSAAQQQVADAETQLMQARAKKLDVSALVDQIRAASQTRLTDAQIQRILSEVDKNLKDTDFKDREGRIRLLEVLGGMLQKPPEQAALPTQIEPASGE